MENTAKITVFLVETRNFARAEQIARALGQSSAFDVVVEGRRFVGLGCVDMEKARLYGRIIGTVSFDLDYSTQVSTNLVWAFI